ncbi:uncharacterized protein [Temnothorax longispinosus]|uniref:uncharacterized protein n=1 Tax=Temnothorax longispinosus TaxID=300112 RepID=UPI003A9A2EDF
MASERWKNDVAYAMTPFKLLAWPIGVWPLQVYNVYSLIRCILATCCMSIIVILPSMEFHMGCTDAEQNIDGLMLACCGVLGVLKTICFRIYAKNLTDNYGSALKDYLTIENTEHRAIMRRHAFMGRTVSCFMVCFSYFSVTIYSLIPLLGEDLTNDQDNWINVTNEDVVLDYPMPSRCALEYLHVPTSMYRIICFLEFIVLILTCTSNHGNDSLFLNITLHMCGQIKILKANFIGFGASSPRVYDRFNALIQRHNYLITLAKELTKSISLVLLTQLFISSILLCIMGFQFILALKMHNVVMMGKSCMVLCTFLTQLSVYSFVGDYLKSQMEEVGLFIYQSIWYNLPTKLAKNLIFIIMRTQSPVKLQAGNFIVVNLATYMSILKTSISYLSVLRVMIETQPISLECPVIRVVFATTIMSDDVWNDDIAYEFSTQRTFMQILGIWPLQKKRIFMTVQWSVMIFIQLSPLIFLYMEFTGNNRDAGTDIEAMLYFATTLSLTLKYICINANGSKMAKNINSAIADWSSAKNDEESYKIMKKHAFKSRLCTLFMLYLAFTCGSLYVLSVVLINLKDLILPGQVVNVSNDNIGTKDRMFIVPCGELGDKITSLQYVMVIMFQTVELLMICVLQSIADSFYIGVTLHLTGQLKLLETKFKIFASKPDARINHRKQFINLVNRHCELVELNQNIEDTFYLIILFQLVIVTLVLALLGLRIIVCLKNSDYVELTKSTVLLNYMFLQSLVYCYGGDFVQKGSEGIFHAMFMASWFKIPARLMKDLNFAMMRSSYPFRLTGGKFFYANCEAMVYILKTAASYVSVLRVTLRD